MSRGLVVGCHKFNYTSKRDRNQYTALTLVVLYDSQDAVAEIFISAEFNANAPQIISNFDNFIQNFKILGSAVTVMYDISGKVIKNIKFEHDDNFSSLYDSIVEVLGKE